MEAGYRLAAISLAISLAHCVAGKLGVLVSRRVILGLDTIRIEETIKRIGQLPTLPTVLGKVLDAAGDPETSAVDLGRHIAVDQSLSATVLRLVNSAYYGFYREITSVPRAVVLLGFREVRKLVLTATAFQSLSGGDSGYDRVQLWRHSLATAMAAERGARMLAMPLPGDGFTAGLLHDVGKVAFDLVYPEQFQRAVSLAHKNRSFVRDAEREVFGIHHGEIGGLLGEHWNMPEPIVESIRFHHEPSLSLKSAGLTNLTGLADYLTYQVGMGEPSNGCEPEYPETSAAALGLTSEQVDELRNHLEQSADTINDLLGVLGSR
ncbi:MAG: HDOD domain-containing protein [Candidatus Hydrogenedentes bacterium]|nr:HDOD domain-containing protein [Candidatus Hydrogenedentota bacterium]